MAEISNETRRLKAKLKLFEEEGFNWVVGDIIMFYGKGMIYTEELEVSIKSLKQYYQRELQKLLPETSKQGKLEL